MEEKETLYRDASQLLAHLKLLDVAGVPLPTGGALPSYVIEGCRSQPKVLFVYEEPKDDVVAAEELLAAAVEKGMGLTTAEVARCKISHDALSASRETQARFAEALQEAFCNIAPQVVVTTGGFALKLLCSDAKPISQARGVWHDCGGLPLLPTYHCAYIVRHPSVKREFWTDLQEVMKKLGLKNN